MTAAAAARVRRRRQHRTGLLVLAAGLVLTLATSVWLGAASTLGVRAPAAVLAAHLAGAAVLVGGLALKLFALRLHAQRKPVRTWVAFVARLGLVLTAYAALTGALVLVEPAWADQHLAASFWAVAAVAAHARQRWAMARHVVRPPKLAADDAQDYALTRRGSA